MQDNFDDWNLESTTKFLYQDSCEVGSLEGDAFTSFRALWAGLGAEIGAAFALEIEGVVYAPTHDQSGSVIALVDAQTGDLVHAARYSAFGQVEKSHGLSPPYQFSSKRLDPETGWIYFGRRYYDSSLGRWTTCDPTGYSDGFNLYAYVHNNPLTHFDEYGLFDGYWDPTPEEIGMYDPRAQFQGMKNAAVYPFTCARDFNFKSLINNSIDVLSNPRVQGSLQAFIGAAEASAGGSAIFCSGGLAAPVGWPVFAHGLDQFVAGMNTAITGRETATITEHLLQTAGMSPQSASITNDLLSVVGTVGASSIIQGSRFQACSRFQLSSSASFSANNKVQPVHQNSIGLWPSATNSNRVINGIEYTKHSLERMSPRGLIHLDTELYSRGIPPSIVENAINIGTKIPGNSPNEIVHIYENVRVVTNPEGSKVITVITTGR